MNKIYEEWFINFIHIYPLTITILCKILSKKSNDIEFVVTFNFYLQFIFFICSNFNFVLSLYIIEKNKFWVRKLKGKIKKGIK